MQVLTSINPRTGFMKEFRIDEEPCVIGNLPLEEILRDLREISKKFPDKQKRRLIEWIDSAGTSIDMRSCQMESRYISRIHCMIFPGKRARLMDLFSKNGTKIARVGGGIRVEPGKKIDLRPDDIIILAEGHAFFQYVHMERGLESESVFDLAAKRRSSLFGGVPAGRQIIGDWGNHCGEYDSMG